jgi:hypothetical protein
MITCLVEWPDLTNIWVWLALMYLISITWLLWELLRTPVLDDYEV